MGVGVGVGGCSVYSAPLAWLPACLLITLYSECLRRMWGVAVGSIGCNVTKHIKDGYSRLVKAPRINPNPFPLLCFTLFFLHGHCLCLFMSISSCLSSSLFVSRLCSFAYLLHVWAHSSCFVSALDALCFISCPEICLGFIRQHVRLFKTFLMLPGFGFKTNSEANYSNKTGKILCHPQIAYDYILAG